MKGSDHHSPFRKSIGTNVERRCPGETNVNHLEIALFNLVAGGQRPTGREDSRRLIGGSDKSVDTGNRGHHKNETDGEAGIYTAHGSLLRAPAGGGRDPIVACGVLRVAELSTAPESTRFGPAPCLMLGA
jgi:hypothetical protein